MKNILILLSILTIGCTENSTLTPEVKANPKRIKAQNKLNSIVRNKDNQQTLDVIAHVMDENNDTVKDCKVSISIEQDSVFYSVNDSNWINISLPLGHKYILGFQKEGYLKKHLIIDIVEYGGYENSKYGFEFPMQLNLIPGDTKKPSLCVAQVEYVDSTGYMNYVLPQ